MPDFIACPLIFPFPNWKTQNVVLCETNKAYTRNPFKLFNLSRSIHAHRMSHIVRRHQGPYLFEFVTNLSPVLNRCASFTPTGSPLETMLLSRGGFCMSLKGTRDRSTMTVVGWWIVGGVKCYVQSPSTLGRMPRPVVPFTPLPEETEPSTPAPEVSPPTLSALASLPPLLSVCVFRISSRRCPLTHKSTVKKSEVAENSGLASWDS